MKLQHALQYVALLSLFTINAMADVSVSGFTDANFRAASSGSGITVNDGAVYLKAKHGSAFGMVDIPFSSAPASTLTLATGKAQAYVGYTYESGCSWTLGQFDGIFGMEAVDSANRFFSMRGNVANAFTPNTMTGLLIDMPFGKMLDVKLVGANTNTSGAVTPTADMGAQVGIAMDTMKLTAGALVRSSDFADMLVDAMLSANMGAMTLGVQFDMFSKSSNLGVAGHLGYNVNEKLGLGARIEYVSMTAASNMQVSVGPSYKMGDKFTVRAGYTYNSAPTTATGAYTASTTGSVAAGTSNAHAVDVSGVLSF